MATSVTDKVDCLVAGAKAGSKLAKAKKLGVAVVDEATLLKMIGSARNPLMAELLLVKRRLESRKDLFSVEVKKKRPITKAKLGKIEAALGVTLPATLRNFYSEVAASYGIYWRIKEAEFNAAGYDSGAIVLWGQAVIRDVGRLGECEWFEGFLQVTDAGSGNGWFLDVGYPKKKRLPVRFGDHDAVDNFGLELKSFDTLLTSFAEYVAARYHEDLWDLLQTGTMSPP